MGTQTPEASTWRETGRLSSGSAAASNNSTVRISSAARPVVPKAKPHSLKQPVLQPSLKLAILLWILAEENQPFISLNKLLSQSEVTRAATHQASVALPKGKRASPRCTVQVHTSPV